MVKRGRGGMTRVGLLALACAVPTAPGASGVVMTLGGAVAPPRAYVDFCLREPLECSERARSTSSAHKVRPGSSASHFWKAAFQIADEQAEAEAGGGPGSASRSEGAGEASRRIALDPKAIHDLTVVNRAVNGQVVSRSDPALYRVRDFWALPLAPGGPARGDCEDYVLEKRRALREAGYPAEALSIALVSTAWGRKHAVLLVSTDQGELVLDSLSPWILSWRDVKYRWLVRQSPSRPEVWVSGAAPHRRAEGPRA